tara:strand:+ start:720 stop:881 length:162 start_codon:yes stop_codon:yes gene_type:complete
MENMIAYTPKPFSRVGESMMGNEESTITQTSVLEQFARFIPTMCSPVRPVSAA